MTSKKENPKWFTFLWLWEKDPGLSKSVVRQTTYEEGTAPQAAKQHPQNQGAAACACVRHEVRGVRGRGVSKWRRWSFRRAEQSFVTFKLTEVPGKRNPLVRESALALSRTHAPRERRARRGCPALAGAVCYYVTAHVR